MSVQFVVISGSFRQVKYKVNLVKMRSGEAAVITSVANRIAHFEQKQGEEQANLANIAVNNQKLKSSSRLTPSNFSQRYLDLDDIMEEESSIEDDSDGYLAASNEETSSPDTSFRLSGRSSSSSGSEHSVQVNNKTSQSEAACSKPNISEKLSQKSLDSGFSDFSDCKDGSDSADKRRLKSSVVHETHATKDSKLHHISKVYFYSVSDLLQDQSTEFEDHLTLLKNESTTSQNSNPNTPRINSSVCEENFFDRVESPFIPISSPASRDSPFQRVTRVHTGTSSLRRKAGGSGAPESSESPSQSPVRKCLTPSQSPFPITNGSLYSDLSLTRRNKESQNRKSRSEVTSSHNCSQDSDNLSSLSPFPSLNCSQSLENFGLNISVCR